MTVSEQIRAARERLGESQAAFAARLGVDQSTIHRWESRGVPDRGPARAAIDSLLSRIGHSEQKLQGAQVQVP